MQTVVDRDLDATFVKIFWWPDAAELWMLDKLAVMEASGEDLEEEAVE